MRKPNRGLGARGAGDEAKVPSVSTPAIFPDSPYATSCSATSISVALRCGYKQAGGVRVAVNISPLQLRHGDLVGCVLEHIHDPSRGRFSPSCWLMATGGSFCPKEPTEAEPHGIPVSRWDCHSAARCRAESAALLRRGCYDLRRTGHSRPAVREATGCRTRKQSSSAIPAPCTAAIWLNL